MTSTQSAPELSYLDQKVAMYRCQVALRQFEQRAYDLFLENYVKGTSHLSIGQEAIAAGDAAAMRPRTGRSRLSRPRAHVGPRSTDDAGLRRADGPHEWPHGGQGRLDALTSVEHGMMGSYAIIGAHLPIACGAAWSAQYRGTDQVAVAFFGDGSVNIGAFHEALNFAAIWKCR